MQAGSRAPSHTPSHRASVSLSRPRAPTGQGRSDPTSRPGAGREQHSMMEGPVSQSPGPPAGLSHRRQGCTHTHAHTHTHKHTCACMSSHPCVCSGLGLPASLPRGAASILGTLRRRAGGKTVRQQLEQGGRLPPGCRPRRACGPGPWTLGCSASSPRSAPTPTPLPGDSRPFWKLPGGGAEAGREIGVWSSPRAQAVSPPLPSAGSGQETPGPGRRAPSTGAAAAFLCLSALGRWTFLRAGQGAGCGLGLG